MGSDYSDEAEELAGGEQDVAANDDLSGGDTSLDTRQLAAEITELEQFIQAANALTTDTKAGALKTLQLGFRNMEEVKVAPRKAIIFTESRTDSGVFV